MTDILAFIGARLDEDERIALSAADKSTSQVWRGNEFGLFPVGNESQHPGAFLADAYGYTPDELIAHITRHDPARVLRDVAAGRRVLARHHVTETSPPDVVSEHPTTITWCRTCNHPGPCPDLLDLASRWSDHPDYDPGWRIEE